MAGNDPVRSSSGAPSKKGAIKAEGFWSLVLGPWSDEEDEEEGEDEGGEGEDEEDEVFNWQISIQPGLAK